MMGETARALLSLLEWASINGLPVEHDPEWSSPCEILPPDNSGYIRWQPVAINAATIFEGVPVHPSICEFYGSYLGGEIEGEHSDESVRIHIAWNDRDLDRITKFVRMQVLSGEPVYIAGTDSDCYFGVDNSTGTVCLCESGHPPMQEVAPSISAFLAEI